MSTPDLKALVAAYKLGGPEALTVVGVHVPDTRTLDRLIAEAVGEASSCWDNLQGAGVFDSQRAIKITERLREAVVNEIIVAQLLPAAAARRG